MSDELCVNTIRCLAADVVQKANSGHPGMPMGMAAAAHTLWNNHIRFSAKNPNWVNRDRFVLSNGHGCALLYVMLHLTGYDLSMDDLKNFRQLHSKTPGHPENYMTPGVEVTTGPLGQGICNAVGMAMAYEHSKATFNRPGFELFDNKVYCFTGDGCLMEGVSSEACSMAGHLGLSSLIVIYDDNHITIDGDTGIAFTEDVGKRYESYGWHVITVADGDHDLQAINAAIEEAKNVKDKPTLIKLRTTIGFGSKLQGTSKVHGAPLGDEDIKNVKTKFGLDPNNKFFVPEEVKAHYAQVSQRGEELREAWTKMFADYQQKYPEEAAEVTRIFIDKKLPDNWSKALPTYTPKDAPVATRKMSEICLNVIADKVPEMIGGSADLAGSNLTHLTKYKDFQKQSFEGRNINFGVREHGMAAICNGMIAYGGYIPYCATFLNFIEYAYGAVRLSALSHFGVVYVMTHDSIGLGEDGPTHQPVEAIPLCRATPNMLVLRPADGNETSGAYQVALENRRTPSVLCLSRQNLPHLEGSSPDKVLLGGYVLHENFDSAKDKSDVIIVSTGSEVCLCVEALAKLAHRKVRIVSMPCVELFLQQSKEYQAQVFPPEVPVLSVEAAGVLGWERFAHASIGMRTFGTSAPQKDVYNYFGFTPQNIAEKSEKLIEYYMTRPVPHLLERPF